jgi:hypothetical protein
VGADRKGLPRGHSQERARRTPCGDCDQHPGENRWRTLQYRPSGCVPADEGRARALGRNDGAIFCPIGKKIAPKFSTTIGLSRPLTGSAYISEVTWQEYLETHQSAAMITVTETGIAKAVRVSVAVVDGKVWSSSTRDRLRTRRLRRDRHCTLFVFDEGYAWLSLETTVTILDGPDAPAHNLRLMRQMQGKPTGPLDWFGTVLDEDAFLRTMVEEGRLIYEFEVHRDYGLY